jgi:6-phosphogluconolactonase
VANFSSANVSALAIDATGALTSVAGAPFAAGSGPVSVTVDPSGKFVFAANQASNNVSAFSVNGATGALTPVAGSPFAAGMYPGYVTTAGQLSSVCFKQAMPVLAPSWGSDANI